MDMSSDRVGIKKEELISIYILRLVDNTYYTGMTNDLDRRMQEHEKGESKSTKYKLPMVLVCHMKVRGRSKAREVEVQIKQRGAGRWLNDIRWKNTKYDLNDIILVNKTIY